MEGASVVREDGLLASRAMRTGLLFCIRSAKRLLLFHNLRRDRLLCHDWRLVPSCSNHELRALLRITCYARYNLGWLPGGDKSITTMLEDTLESIEAAQRLVKHGGMISVMLYRGHAEVSRSPAMN